VCVALKKAGGVESARTLFAGANESPCFFKGLQTLGNTTLPLPPRRLIGAVQAIAMGGGF